MFASRDLIRQRWIIRWPRFDDHVPCLCLPPLSSLFFNKPFFLLLAYYPSIHLCGPPKCTCCFKHESFYKYYLHHTYTCVSIPCLVPPFSNAGTPYSVEFAVVIRFDEVSIQSHVRCHAKTCSVGLCCMDLGGHGSWTYRGFACSHLVSKQV